MFRRITSMLLTVVLASTLAVGCSPAKKPIPKTPNRTAPRTAPAPVPAPTPARKPAPSPITGTMPTTSAELNRIATKLAKDAAKVHGVKKATVALSSTTAYVGIDLAPNIEAGKTDAIKKEVAKKVKAGDKRLTNVYVTSDVGVVTRIKHVATGIGKGKPISSFTRELTEIGRRIAPKPAK